MADLVDREAIKDAIGFMNLHFLGHGENKSVLDSINEVPSVDAVPVVRCKDCKHYDNSEGIQWCHLNSKFYPGGMDWLSYPEDGFCCYGGRKDNGL